MSNVTFAAMLSHPLPLTRPAYRSHPSLISLQTQQIENSTTTALSISRVFLSTFSFPKVRSDIGYLGHSSRKWEAVERLRYVCRRDCRTRAFVSLWCKILKMYPLEIKAFKIELIFLRRIYFAKLVNRQISKRAEFHQIPMRSATFQLRINWGIVLAYCWVMLRRSVFVARYI